MLARSLVTEKTSYKGTNEWSKFSLGSSDGFQRLSDVVNGFLSLLLDQFVQGHAGSVFWLVENCPCTQSSNA